MHLHLAEIWIYPVKSLAGTSVSEAMAEESGFMFDRRWVVVDASGKFLTQREHPEMALIDVTLNETHLVLHDRHLLDDQICISYSQTFTGILEQVQIWNDIVMAYAVSDEANAWLSRRLGKTVRLMAMQDKTSRVLNLPYLEKDFALSFADEFPYLLTSDASLEDLNSKLPTPVDMRRFRPNLVITGNEPFEEDSWKQIKIGSVIFSVCKPCERCMVINVDPDEGVRNREPLKTLASFRKRDRKILFGQDLVALNEGIIRVGDKVIVL